MNKTVIFTFASLLMGIVPTYGVIIEPVSSEQSECKTRMSDTRYWGDDKDLSATISYESGKLTLSVYDYMDNCCGLFSTSADIEGYNIHFTVADKSDMPCDCICPFDITGVYDGILEGTYNVYFESYPGYPLLSKQITITDGCLQTLSGNEITNVSSINNDCGLTYRTDNVLEVKFQGSTLIEIFDAEGKRTAGMTLHSPCEVSLYSLAPGLYIIRAQNENNRTSIRCLR
ncbi:MAG: T9SS type A sorting domain-containing protein [Muribaculaceae bacterium]|nr:T9SS type A sorting domain-containing protein [Muribaculaceae bacterium]